MPVFAWPDCPDGVIAVPGRRARVVRGQVIPGRRRWEVRFKDGVLKTGQFGRDEADVVAAVRARMPFARGEIRELGSPKPSKALAEGTLEAVQAILARLGPFTVSDEFGLDGGFAWRPI